MDEPPKEPADAGTIPLNYTAPIRQPRQGVRISVAALILAILPYVAVGLIRAGCIPQDSVTQWIPGFASLLGTVGAFVGIILALTSVFTASSGLPRAIGGISLVLLSGWCVILVMTDVLRHLLFDLVFWGWSGPG